jgi:F0F1-type ATP synthase assembly protein I
MPIVLSIPMTTPEPSDRKPASQRGRGTSWLAASAAPWLMLAAVVMGVVAGVLLDGHFGSAPWGVVLCSGFGLAAGVYLVVREGNR